MPNELIRVHDGHATLTDTAFRVVDVLNPLGSGAKIVATLGACTVEIVRLRSKRQQLAASRGVAMDIMRTRQMLIMGLFDANAREAEIFRVERQGIREALHNVSALVRDRHSSNDLREMALGTMQIMTGQIVHSHAIAGDNLVRLIDSLTLGNTLAVIEALRALDR